MANLTASERIGFSPLLHIPTLTVHDHTKSYQLAAQRINCLVSLFQCAVVIELTGSLLRPQGVSESYLHDMRPLNRYLQVML